MLLYRLQKNGNHEGVNKLLAHLAGASGLNSDGEITSSVRVVRRVVSTYVTCIARSSVCVIHQGCSVNSRRSWGRCVQLVEESMHADTELASFGSMFRVMATWIGILYQAEPLGDSDQLQLSGISFALWSQMEAVSRLFLGQKEHLCRYNSGLMIVNFVVGR